MKQNRTIRQEVAEILTDLYGNKAEGIIFRPEDTIRRSVGGKRYTKRDLKISQSWSAKFKGNETIWVNCVGMTMTEFIKEYKADNIISLVSKAYGFPEITIYRNKPEWKTHGYVKELDPEKGRIYLYLPDLLLVDEIEAEITKETPIWLIEAPPNLSAAFTCKIYQGWRSMKSFNNFNWSKVWKTFKFDGYLSEEEVENFI